MCVASTAKRRRRQAKNNFNHLSGQGVTRYKKKDASVAARRLAQLVAEENARRQRKARK